MGSKKTSRRHQKVYKMKGCSKKTRKNYLGGSVSSGADINLAYPGSDVKTAPNPFLAYTGRGGSALATMTTNINGANKTIPNTGPPVGIPTAPVNQAGSQKGGNCGCGLPLMKGGTCSTCAAGMPNPLLMKGGRRKKGGCGALCGVGFMVGGKMHRLGCKCSTCKLNKSVQMGGNPGIPYPNGLVGAPWTPEIGGWPGVSGVQGGSNYIPPNSYQPDIQTAIISAGAQRPFSVGGKRRSRKQRGGTLSNFLGQDLINLGRQFQFNLGSAYNGLAGYAAPTNPMPWKGQLPNTPSLSTVKAASL